MGKNISYAFEDRSRVKVRSSIRLNAYATSALGATSESGPLPKIRLATVSEMGRIAASKSLCNHSSTTATVTSAIPASVLRVSSDIRASINSLFQPWLRPLWPPCRRRGNEELRGTEIRAELVGHRVFNLQLMAAPAMGARPMALMDTGSVRVRRCGYRTRAGLRAAHCVASRRSADHGR